LQLQLNFSTVTITNIIIYLFVHVLYQNIDRNTKIVVNISVCWFNQNLRNPIQNEYDKKLIWFKRTDIARKLKKLAAWGNIRIKTKLPVNKGEIDENKISLKPKGLENF